MDSSSSTTASISFLGQARSGNSLYDSMKRSPALLRLAAPSGFRNEIADSCEDFILAAIISEEPDAKSHTFLCASRCASTYRSTFSWSLSDSKLEPMIGVLSTQSISDSTRLGLETASSSMDRTSLCSSPRSAILLKESSGSMPPILSLFSKPRRISNCLIWKDSNPEALPRPSLNARNPWGVRVSSTVHWLAISLKISVVLPRCSTALGISSSGTGTCPSMSLTSESSLITCLNQSSKVWCTIMKCISSALTSLSSPCKPSNSCRLRYSE